MTRKKKKFKDTTVGKILGGALSLINPALGNVVQGSNSVEDIVQAIKDTQIPMEDKIKAQEMVLKAYEAEVDDRISARQREAAVASTGSSDILFKSIGWTVSLAFLFVIASALGFIEIPEGNQRGFDMAFGAVVAKMTAIISYYFGSSIGSKQKTSIMNETL